MVHHHQDHSHVMILVSYQSSSLTNEVASNRVSRRHRHHHLRYSYPYYPDCCCCVAPAVMLLIDHLILDIDQLVRQVLHIVVVLLNYQIVQNVDVDFAEEKERRRRKKKRVHMKRKKKFHIYVTCKIFDCK